MYWTCLLHKVDPPKSPLFRKSSWSRKLLKQQLFYYLFKSLCFLIICVTLILPPPGCNKKFKLEINAKECLVHLQDVFLQNVFLLSVFLLNVSLQNVSCLKTSSYKTFPNKRFLTKGFLTKRFFPKRFLHITFPAKKCFLWKCFLQMNLHKYVL